MPQKDGLYALKLNNLGYITPPGTERFIKKITILRLYLQAKK